MSIATGLRRAVGATPAVPSAKSGLSLEDWPWSSTPPSWLLAQGTASIDLAVGLPAWLSVIRRLAHGAGMSPLIVYSGDREDRDRAPETWQYELLHGDPGEGTPFNLLADLTACIAASGNGYVRKLSVGAGRRARVGELMVLDPRNVTPRRRGGEIVYDDQTSGASVIRTRAEIIHVRDFNFGIRDSVRGELDLVGVNPIQSLRTAVGTGVQRQAWERAYFSNDARPGVALTFPENLPIDKAQEVLNRWNAHHQGSENAGKAGALSGGADIKVIPPISLADAQFVEAAALSRETIAGLYGVPPSLVGDTKDALTGEPAQIHFAIFGLGPILTMIEQALSHDEGLFPPGSGLFCEALPDALVRPVIQSRYDAYRLSRQGGWRTANEIRQLDNLPPHPDGDVLQVTPVGGGENPNAPAPEPPDTDPGATEETPDA